MLGLNGKKEQLWRWLFGAYVNTISLHALSTLDIIRRYPHYIALYTRSSAALKLVIGSLPGNFQQCDQSLLKLNRSGTNVIHCLNYIKVKQNVIPSEKSS